jgi:hypothetical protein
MMKMTLRKILVLSAVLGAGYGLLRVTGIIDPDACISETMMTIPDLSGVEVEVVYVNCDTLAKEEAVSVYFSPSAMKRAPWFRRWMYRKTLVFRYDPSGRADTPLPSITHPSQSTILISIPRVSSIFYQNQRWENMSINYDIGRVDDPAASK